MKRRKTIAVVAVLTVLLAYVGTFVVWSRVGKICSTIDPKTEQVQEVSWAFFDPPYGMMSLELALKIRNPDLGLTPPGEPHPRDVWRSREKLLEVIFYPCLWLDENLTNRRYLLWGNGPIVWM